MDTETNPLEAEVEGNEALEQELGSTEAEDLANPDGEAGDGAEETAEIEIDGVKYKIPAALKDGFLMQSDYTRKTQEIAAERKALAEARERVQQAGEAEVNARASVIAIEAALQQYQNVNWDALEAQDPQSANRHFRQYMQLQNALGEAQNEYQSAVQARTLETQHEAAKRIEQGVAELQRDIPGWGPELASQLMDFGASMGFSREYMESVDDPKLVKLMHTAFVAQKAMKPVAPKVDTQSIKPAAKVKGGGQPLAGLDDRLGMDEWLKRRSEQIRRK